MIAGRHTETGLFRDFTLLIDIFRRRRGIIARKIPLAHILMEIEFEILLHIRAKKLHFRAIFQTDELILEDRRMDLVLRVELFSESRADALEIGRASFRERVCKSV